MVNNIFKTFLRVIENLIRLKIKKYLLFIYIVLYNNEVC